MKAFLIPIKVTEGKGFIRRGVKCENIYNMYSSTNKENSFHGTNILSTFTTFLTVFFFLLVTVGSTFINGNIFIVPWWILFLIKYAVDIPPAFHR